MVDVDLVGRVVVKPVRPYKRQVRILLCHAEQLIARLHELVVTKTATILELHIEPRRRAERGNRRRIDRNDDRILVRSEVLGRASQNRLHFEVGAGPDRPILESYEDQSLVLSAPREIQTVDL